MICSVEGCEKEVYANGYCESHYNRVRRYGSTNVRLGRVRSTEICSIEGCSRVIKCKQLCNKHYVRLQKYGSTDDLPPRIKNTSPCSVENCSGIVHAKGYCLRHYKRLLKRGNVLRLNGTLKGKVCKVPSCSNPVISSVHMLCNKHSLRMKRHGTVSDSVLVNTRSLSLEDRLKRGSKINEKTECWEWQRGLFTNGYGQISVDGSTIGTHRASYIAFIGPIPEGLLVLHTCDNPICVNPKHLWLGTHRDNMEDMVKKGRSAVVNNGNVKLTLEQVKSIKRQYDGTNLEWLAETHFVTPTTIISIVYGNSWKHVLPELTLPLNKVINRKKVLLNRRVK